LAAWQALFEHGQLQPGQRVLVLGASGGDGTFAVQFARWAGAEVFGTTSTRNLEFVRSLGATPIDYTAGPFEEAVQDVDLVIDLLGGDSQLRAWRTLKPSGAMISVVAPPSDPDGSRRTGRVRFHLSTQKTKQLAEIGELLANGTVQVVIDEILPFHEIQQAFIKSASGRARGKIILDLTA
jgi:NADPH:quinone reductase-like Zn-dependent oxidoreductase